MDGPQAEYRIADSDKCELLDLLSELPNSLILVILSLLPTRDIVQTTLLSKRWKDFWCRVPCLDFQHRFYNFLAREDNVDKFRNFVNGALALWKGTKIFKFSLDLMFLGSIRSDVDSWLKFAIERQVEELYIKLTEYKDLYDNGEVEEYYAPQCLYLCSSISKLSLISCKLKFVENVHWNQLKSLTIQGSESLDDYAMNQILSGSPQLEELNLHLMESCENFNIRSISLKMLIIFRYQNAGAAMLRIWAPNLETLDISQGLYDSCLLCVPSLKSAVLGFCDQNYSSEHYSSSILHEEMLRQVMLSVCHVEKVTLSYWCTKVLSKMKMKMKMKMKLFPTAKILLLRACAADEALYVLDMFPKLTVLILQRELLRSVRLYYGWLLMRHHLVEDPSAVHEFDPSHNLLKPKADLPSPSVLHLRRVEIIWDLRDTPIFPVLEIILENARMLEKMVIWTKSPGAVPGSLFVLEEKVKSIPRSSPTAELIIINNC